MADRSLDASYLGLGAAQAEEAVDVWGMRLELGRLQLDVRERQVTGVANLEQLPVAA